MDCTFEIRSDHAVITGASDCLVLDIPDRVQGMPVTEIAPHAFEGRNFPEVRFPKTLKKIGGYAFHGCEGLTSVTLPACLTEIGSYAFYDCHHLETIFLTDGIRVIDNDSFLGCDGVREITLSLKEGRAQMLKTMLSELFQEILVKFEYRDREPYAEAEIVFPEYYVDYVENHPARVFEEHTIGSGRVYRKCFNGPDFDYMTYDRHFAIACKKDLPPQAARVALARLKTPYRMTDRAKKDYTDWLKTHAVESCTQFVDKEDSETLLFLYREGILSAESLDRLLDAAIEGKKNSILPWLAKVCRQTVKKTEKKFEL